MRKLKAAAIFEIPTPYRQPVLEKIASRDDIDVDFFFLNRTQADRHWTLPDPVHFIPRYFPGAQVCIRGHHTIHLNRDVLPTLKRTSYDVLVIGGYAQWALFTALRHSWRSGLPYVMVTESHLGKRRSGWLRAGKKRYVRKVYERSGANLVTGSAARDYVLEYGAAEAGVGLFPNTIDGPSYATEVDCTRAGRSDFRRKLGFSENDTVILYVGTLNRRKGVDLLLAAFEKLAFSRPDLKLLLAGTGVLEPAIRKLAETGLKNRLVWPGFVESQDLPSYYAAADVFILPSREEPFGAVVCEAAAAGLPVIVSDAVGAARDFVLPEKSGLIFPSEDPGALERSLLTLIENPERRREAGMAGRTLMKQWTHDRLAGNFVQAAEFAVRGVR